MAEKSTSISIGSGIGGFLFVITWMAGIVLAKGFWLTMGSMFFPPYAIYLVVERAMILLKVIP